MSLLILIFDKHFKRFKSSLVLSPIIKGELLSITINCKLFGWNVQNATSDYGYTCTITRW